MSVGLVVPSDYTLDIDISACECVWTVLLGAER